MSLSHGQGSALQTFQPHRHAIWKSSQIDILAILCRKQKHCNSLLIPLLVYSLHYTEGRGNFVNSLLMKLSIHPNIIVLTNNSIQSLDKALEFLSVIWRQSEGLLPIWRHRKRLRGEKTTVVNQLNQPAEFLLINQVCETKKLIFNYLAVRSSNTNTEYFSPSQPGHHGVSE